MTSLIEVGIYKVDKNVFLRHGNFGSVYEAVGAEGEQIAAEEIALPTESKRFNLESAKEDIDLLITLECPYLVNVIGHEEINGIIWVFTDFCKYDLEHYYIDKSPTGKIPISLMKDMAGGLKYLHKNDIIHRDIQPSSILISVANPLQPTAKIAGYHNVQNADEPDGVVEATMGKTLYMAPELFSPDLERGQPMDIFALGLTFFAMTCFIPNGQVLVPAENPRAIVEIGKEMKQMSMYGNIGNAKKYNADVIKIPENSPEFKTKLLQVIRKMIAFDQHERLTAADVRRSIKQIEATGFPE